MNMKKIYLYTLMVSLLSLGLASCEDDKEPVLSVKSTAELEPMPQSEYSFSAGNAADPFVVKWKNADLGFQAVNMYTVTLTNNANGRSVELGKTGGSELSLTNEQINTYAANLFVAPGKAADMSLSLAYSAYDGMLDSTANNTIDLKITPYDPNAVAWDYIYVAAGYPQWDFTKCFMLGDPDEDGVYEGYASFEGASTFALLNGKTMEVLAEGKQIDGAGFYKLTYAPDDSEVTVSDNIRWGIVGDATPGGWDADTELEYDADTRMWSKVARLAVGKAFKFRGNNNWDINLGALEGEEENMGGSLTAGGKDMKVVFEKDTTFMITLSLTEAGEYTYAMEATRFEQSSEFITMPGSYQSWSPEADNCYRLLSPGRDFVFSGAHYIPAGTEFKFWDKGTWIGMDGAISGGAFTINPGGGDNIKIANGGYYKFTVNLKKLTCTFVDSGWGIVGAGSPSGSWDTDTMMSYDPDTKKWSLTATFVGGEIKFRWDRSWDNNLGGTLDALKQGGDNIVVAAGKYLVVLDEAAGKATMTPQ